MFFLKPKTSKGRISWFFNGFLDIVVFCINYALKPYSYYLLFLCYNLTLNLHEFIFYSIYTTLPLSVYSRVLGYFWLSRLKPKKPTKKHKNHKKPKTKKPNF